MQLDVGIYPSAFLDPVCCRQGRAPCDFGLGCIRPRRTKRVERTARLRLSCIHAFLAGSRSPATFGAVNTILRTTILIALGSLLAGCETSPKPKPVAHFTHDARGGYEIQLDASYRTCSRGPCRFPSFIPRTFDTTDWIYTKVIEGEIPAAQIVVTHERGKTEYPWPQSRLRGSITFSPGHMRVALDSPYYKDGVSIHHYEPYSLNGDYTLQPQ